MGGSWGGKEEGVRGNPNKYFLFFFGCRPVFAFFYVSPRGKNLKTVNISIPETEIFQKWGAGRGGEMKLRTRTGIQGKFILKNYLL